jgi:glycosyltransferase involved in cell wall biosynthesis
MSTQFSIITVCYNAAQCIGPTIDSLTRQTWPHIEYIVVDGQSKDGTQDIVRSHGSRVTTFVSEPDKGIYDAMNKGIALAQGDVLFFLNADDAFCDPGVLMDVGRAFDADPGLDVVYGNVVHTIGKGPSQRRVTHSFHWITSRNIYFGDLCHQALFVRKRVFDRVGGFDLGYPINADYDWVLRIFHSGVKSLYIDRDVCDFAEGGFHMQHPEQQTRERLAIKHKYHTPLRTWLGYWALRVELKIRKLKGERIS